MACFGTKAIRRKSPRAHNSVGTNDMTAEDDAAHKGGAKRMKKNAKKRGHSGTVRCDHSMEASGDKLKKTKKDSRLRKGKHGLDKDGHSDKNSTDGTTTKQQSASVKHPSILRKKVDPGTAKYFLEIAKLFDGNRVDLERPIICANALDETIGKELELATDTIISHTLQILIEGCDLDRLCSFLQRCANDFPLIAMDKYGSRVVETALKSLTVHLQDQDTLEIIEETLIKICKVVVIDPVNMMCSCYGSHVLRSLLCLCKGMPLDSLEEFHIRKSSTVLAARLNIKSTRTHGYQSGLQQGFLELLKFLVLEILKNAGNEIKTLRVNKHSSFVLQVAMRLLVGDDLELRKAILMVLCCSEDNSSEGLLLESNIQEIVDLVKDSAASHLLEVILEVAPDNMYEVILQKVFKGSLHEMSCHHCGNFAVQALISSARCKDQVDLIWEELGAKMKELIETGKSGVVASLLASCQCLETHGQECCKVLAHTICSEGETPSCIVPKLLFLDNYLCCKEKSCWQCPSGDRMHILGCLMLQTVFRFPNHCFFQYASSMVSIEIDQVLEMAKDAAGSHVLESFLCSDASGKVKLKVMSKLKGHFGELSLHPFGSFIVEKCFAASKLPFKEALMLEVSTIKDELSKSKHGIHILKKLDVFRFVKQQEQWKSSQASKENVYREYQTAFGSNTKSRGGETFLSQLCHASHEKSGKGCNQLTSQTDNVTSKPLCLLSSDTDIPDLQLSMAKLGFVGFKNGKKRSHDADGGKTTACSPSKKFVRNSVENCFVRQGGKRKSSLSDLADLAGKKALSASDVQKLFESNTESQKRMRK